MGASHCLSSCTFLKIKLHLAFQIFQTVAIMIEALHLVLGLKILVSHEPSIKLWSRLNCIYVISSTFLQISWIFEYTVKKCSILSLSKPHEAQWELTEMFKECKNLKFWFSCAKTTTEFFFCTGANWKLQKIVPNLPPIVSHISTI